MARSQVEQPDMHGPIIRAWCERKGIKSLRKLARLAGLGPNVVNRLANGQPWTPEYKAKIAGALGITPEELDHMPPSDGALQPSQVGQDIQDNLPEPLPEGIAPVIDAALAQLGRKISASVKALTEEWLKQQQFVRWKNEQEHLKDMLRRILLRASTSAPAEYDIWYQLSGAPYSPIEGAEEIVRLAIELVNNASINQPTSQDRDAILVTWRGERDPIGAIRDVHLRTQWVSAIRGATTRGWNYKHYIQLAGDQTKALRSVLNVLAFLGPSGRYQPHLLVTPAPKLTQSSEPDPDYLVVPGQGVLVLYGAKKADYFPYLPGDEKSEDSFEQLYDRVTQLTAESEPLYQLYPQLSRERREALILLEAANGHRILCMDGLPQNLMPADVQKNRYEALTKILQERGAPQDLLDFAKETLQSRKDREQLLREQLANGRYRHRDICPESAIRRLVKEGRTSHKDVDDTFTRIAILNVGMPDFPVLTLEQRRQCLNELVQRLRDFPQYELVLLPDAKADIFGTHCLIKDGQGVLLQFWKRQRGGAADRPREHVAIYISDPTVVRAFADNPLLQLYDRDLEHNNKPKVIAFLEKQIASLDRKIAAQRSTPLESPAR